MVQEHFLGQRRALAQAQQLQHLVFLAGQMNGLIVHFYRLGIEIDGDLARPDHRFRMALGPPDDRVDPRHQFFAVEGFRQVVVGTEAEALDLVLGIVRARQDQDRRFDARRAQLAQNLVPVHVRQIEIEYDQIVVIELGKIDAFFAHIRRVDIEIGVRQHQFDAFRCRRIILDQKYPHSFKLRLVIVLALTMENKS